MSVAQSPLGRLAHCPFVFPSVRGGTVTQIKVCKSHACALYDVYEQLGLAYIAGDLMLMKATRPTNNNS